jgi:hypothetical protein
MSVTSGTESRGLLGENRARRGDWMQTFTGRAFWPLDPRPEDIDPADIAHSLSMLCRYGGHVSRFYSVAEHCVLMSRAVSSENALWALLHDATEAYLVDLPRPLKRSMPKYQDVELVLMWSIAARFGIPADEPGEVREADNRILHDERAELMRESPWPWTAIEDVEPLGVPILGWRPGLGEQLWLERLAELTEGGSP